MNIIVTPLLSSNIGSISEKKPSTSSMAVKPTKAPSMGDDTPYSDWKKQVEIWQKTNEPLGVAKTVLAGTLFETLSGQARDTVLSGLQIDEICCDTGVANILKTLDEFYAENTTLSAFTAQDNFHNFRRKSGTSFKDFLVEFQLRVNKVKLGGTDLSDGVLGYWMLKCANIPEDKEQLVRATCEKLDLKTVRTQLDKLSLNPNSTAKSDQMKFADVKTESGPSSSTHSAFYQHHSSNNHSSSEDDLDHEIHDAFYGRNRDPYRGKWDPKFKLNPASRFNNQAFPCKYCFCIFHLPQDCMYAPEELKREDARRFNNRRHSGFKKPKYPL